MNHISRHLFHLGHDHPVKIKLWILPFHVKVQLLVCYFVSSFIFPVVR